MTALSVSLRLITTHQFKLTSTGVSQSGGVFTMPNSVHYAKLSIRGHTLSTHARKHRGRGGLQNACKVVQGGRGGLGLEYARKAMSLRSLVFTLKSRNEPKKM